MKKLLKYLLLIAGIVIADQITKLLVVANIPLHTDIPFLPGILSLTYTQNIGAAWSMFPGQQWLFASVFVVLTVLLLVEFFKKPLPFTAVISSFVGV